MAVTNQLSDLANIQTGVTASRSGFYATEYNGDIQIMRFSHTQSGAGDAGSDVHLGKLPPGRVRVLGSLSNIHVNWTTASATIDLGWDAYTGLDGTAVASNPDVLDDGVSVESAGAIPVGTTQDDGTYLFESKDGVDLFATSPGAIADGDTIAGFIAYVST